MLAAPASDAAGDAPELEHHGDLAWQARSDHQPPSLGDGGDQIGRPEQLRRLGHEGWVEHEVGGKIVDATAVG